MAWDRVGLAVVVTRTGGSALGQVDPQDCRLPGCFKPLVSGASVDLATLVVVLIAATEASETTQRTQWQ